MALIPNLYPMNQTYQSWKTEEALQALYSAGENINSDPEPSFTLSASSKTKRYASTT